MIAMPWGKHRGCLLSEVPSGYLAFVVEDSNATESLKDACRRVLADRFGDACDPEPQPKSPPWQQERHSASDTDGVSREKIKRWYRRASLQAHPDRGGSAALMKLLNELMEL